MARRIFSLVAFIVSIFTSAILCFFINLFFTENYGNWNLGWVYYFVNISFFLSFLIISFSIFIHLICWLAEGKVTFERWNKIAYALCFLFFAAPVVIVVTIENHLNSGYFSTLEPAGPSDTFSAITMDGTWIQDIPSKKKEGEVLSMDLNYRYRDQKIEMDGLIKNKEDALYVYNKIKKTNNKKNTTDASCVIEYYNNQIEGKAMHPWCNYSNYKFAHIKRYPMVDRPYESTDKFECKKPRLVAGVVCLVVITIDLLNLQPNTI